MGTHLARTRKTVFGTLFAILVLTNAFVHATIVTEQEHGGVAYFLVDSPSRWERYNLPTRSWLTPISLPSSRGVPTAGLVDNDGIYVGYNNAAYRYNAAGTGEIHLLNLTAGQNIHAIHSDGSLLFLNHSESYYAKCVSISKSNNTIIDTVENYIDALHGSIILPSLDKMVGTRTSGSPSDVSFMDYTDPAGIFGNGGDSPHHGDYPVGTRIWAFPDEARFVDTEGIVYSSSSISYLSAFPSEIDTLTFNGNNPIVADGASLTAYSAGLLPAGSANLSGTPDGLYVDAADVIVATEDANEPNGIRIDTVPLASLNAPTPGAPINPAGLPYTPDHIFLGNDGIVHLFSKAHQSIFRWDPATQSYTDTIPLLGIPEFAAFTPTDDIVYLAYSSGLIRKISLATPGTWNEVPFANLPQTPLALSTAAQYVFAVDASGAWESHYTFDPAGQQVDWEEWNYPSQEFIWNEPNQKLYFFRSSSPTDILWEEINADGVTYPAEAPGGIGAKMDSPLHSSTGFDYPIRVKPDGSIVVLGSGVIHDATTLVRDTLTLANSVSDITWLNGELKTVRDIAGLTQFQHWELPTYSAGTSVQYPGIAHRLLSLNTTDLVAINIAADGVPSFYIFDCDFLIQPPATLAAPINITAVVGATNSEIDLTWTDVTGETGYNIERQILGGAWSQISTTSASVTTFSDNSVVVGNTYCYRITATHSSASLISPLSNVGCIDFDVPNAPTNVAVTTAGTTDPTDELLITWSDVTTETTYTLERRTGSTGTWIVESNSIPADDTSYLDTFLSQNTYYEYRIKATNAIGDSAYSVIAGATTDAVPPTSFILYTPTPTFSSVPLDWSTSSYANGYDVQRRPGGTSNAWATIASTTTTSAYTDNSVLPSTSYDYRIISSNSAGTEISNAITISTPAAPAPDTPIALVARVLSASSAEIEWNDVAGETSFLLERQNNAGSWLSIASVNANVTTYTDTGLISGDTYAYRVTAINSSGSSLPSNIDIIIPQAVICVLEDDFDPGTDLTVWSSNTGISINGGTGFRGTNALHFSNSGTRLAATTPAFVPAGGYIEFVIRAGNQTTDGNTYWNNAETGEDVVLEFSIDGTNWNLIQTFTASYPNLSTWEGHSVEIPSNAFGVGTQFRWRQLSHSGTNFDCFALEDVCVRAYDVATIPAPGFAAAFSNSSTQATFFWGAVPQAAQYRVERSIDGINWILLSTEPQSPTPTFIDNSVIACTPYHYRVQAIDPLIPAISTFTYAVPITTPSQFGEWRFANFGSTNDTGTAASTFTGTDGVSNLMRFASGLDATEPATPLPVGGSKGLPRGYIDIGTNKLCLEFIRRKPAGNPKVTYTVEFSFDLFSWSTAGSIQSTTSIDSIFERIVWEDFVPAGSYNGGRFVRLRIDE